MFTAVFFYLNKQKNLLIYKNSIFLVPIHRTLPWYCWTKVKSMNGHQLLLCQFLLVRGMEMIRSGQAFLQFFATFSRYRGFQLLILNFQVHGTTAFAPTVLNTVERMSTLALTEMPFPAWIGTKVFWQPDPGTPVLKFGNAMIWTPIKSTLNMTYSPN